MRKLTVFTGLSSVMLIFIISGCSHITHRARVNEGINMSVFVMPDYETYDPPDRIWDPGDDRYRELQYSRTDCQVSWGYAWRLQNDRKVMLNLNAATAFRYPYDFVPSVGVYYQQTPDDLPYASGIGAIILPDPTVYWLVGRDLGGTGEGKIAELEFGAGFALYPSLLFHFKLLKQMGPFLGGVIGEYRYFWPYTGVSLGDEGYRDYVKSQLFFGVILVPELQ